MLLQATDVILVAATAGFLFCWPVNSADMGWDAVTVKNGKCQYKGREIQRGSHVDVEHPCERWKCEVTENLVLFLGCGFSQVQAPCKVVNGSGVYPKCCPKPVCPSHHGR
ncbi:complement inhibitor CirpT1-like [Dermacentor andersoni]|uniref:complement inhibitor CirpT1-like n=1 Tax=Dermacentor andersoni TaxID=34620 RepID=UPI0021555E4A|nr:complement inhibitor CirpT1-like [Dermacentor andersoni]